MLYKSSELKDFCESEIGANAKGVFATDDFMHCDREMLMQILKSNKLRCKEVELFDACIEWARAACEHKNIDATKVENLRLELGDAIYQVRFGSLTIDEFNVRHKSPEGFFTADESNEIFHMIGKSRDFESKKKSNTHIFGMQISNNEIKSSRTHWP